MESERWGRPYKSYVGFYETTYDEAIVECRSIEAAGASMFYARQGAGEWSDAPSPVLVVADPDPAGSLVSGRSSTQRSALRPWTAR